MAKTARAAPRLLFLGAWPWVMILAAGLALAVRLPRLALRPMHGDEANQAVRARDFRATGLYDYDTHDHHGPSLSWLTLPALALSGAADFAHSSEAAYRIVPVLFGAGLVLLLLLLADGLGRGPALLAAVLTALSPAMVFYSRYYIQETLLVFFTAAAIASAWRYACSRSPAWAVAAGCAVGLMHATKETWVLAAAAMGLGLLLTAAWTRVRGGTIPAVRPYLRPAPLAAAAICACLVAVAFYSSLGKDWRGPLESVLAYANYWHRGRETPIHTHPWYYYFQLLLADRPARGFFWSEGFIAGLAVVGSVAAMWGRGLDGPADTGSRKSGASLAFCRFLVFYTLVLAALYAAIPYKTPWCMLSFLHGLILLAGVGAWVVLRGLPGLPLKALAAAALLAGVAHLGWQCYALNFRFYADQRNPYVYAHTSPDVLNLAGRLERLAHCTPEGHEMQIHVVTPENYWPLPWYLRRFDHVGYWPSAAAWANDVPATAPPAVIILTPDVQAAVDSRLRAAYNKQMLFGLRPGVLVAVYVREELWKECTRCPPAPTKR